MNYYARAIEIVTDPDIDRKAVEILARIARKYPSAVVFAVDGSSQRTPPTETPKLLTDDKAELKAECKRLKEDHKVEQAVRLWRENTGGTFKQAREQVGSL